MSDGQKSNDQQKAQKEIVQLFTEIGIIEQLSTAKFNKVMPEGLHVSHFGVISHLKRMDDGCTPLQIANAMQVTKATMTHTISVLEKRGLIEIKSNPKDGRSKQVFLTQSGDAFYDKAIVALAAAYQPILTQCDIPALIATLPALTALRKVLDENR